MQMPNPMLIAVALAAIALAAPSPAHADDWNKKYTFTGKPTVRIDTDDGDVDITTGATNEINLHLSTRGFKIGPGDVHVIESQDGNKLQFDVKAPHGHFFSFGIGSHSIKVQIQVPPESDLDIHTSDGSVTVQPVAGSIRIDTGDGSINASASPGSKITNPWNLHSGDGSITLRIPENFAADLDAHTGDGHINLDFPVTVSGSLSESRVRGKMNGGGGTLEINSGDGSIHIEKL